MTIAYSMKIAGIKEPKYFKFMMKNCLKHETVIIPFSTIPVIEKKKFNLNL
jgi:hypothetical protein